MAAAAAAAPEVGRRLAKRLAKRNSHLKSGAETDYLKWRETELTSELLGGVVVVVARGGGPARKGRQLKLERFSRLLRL